MSSFIQSPAVPSKKHPSQMALCFRILLTRRDPEVLLGSSLEIPPPLQSQVCLNYASMSNITAAWAVDQEFFYIFWVAWAPFASLWLPLGCPWAPIWCPRAALGSPWASLERPWAPLGCPWAPLECHWAPLGCPWAFSGRPWVSLGIPGRLRKKMCLKYRACAQDLASGNLPGGPAGPAEIVS
jgi:hypothetical protein